MPKSGTSGSVGRVGGNSHPDPATHFLPQICDERGWRERFRGRIAPEGTGGWSRVAGTILHKHLLCRHLRRPMRCSASRRKCIARTTSTLSERPVCCLGGSAWSEPVADSVNRLNARHLMCIHGIEG